MEYAVLVISVGTPMCAHGEHPPGGPREMTRLSQSHCPCLSVIPIRRISPRQRGHVGGLRRRTEGFVNTLLRQNVQRSAAFEEMLRIIREEEPSKPSTKVSSSHSLPSIAANRHIDPARLGNMIRGELDWIVMKAFEKDRARRYETATGLSTDIERSLSDEPVVACPPSATYRFRKFARRRTLVGGS